MSRERLEGTCREAVSGPTLLPPYSFSLHHLHPLGLLLPIRLCAAISNENTQYADQSCAHVHRRMNSASGDQQCAWNDAH
jgi:hypothetical protein